MYLKAVSCIINKTLLLSSPYLFFIMLNVKDPLHFIITLIAINPSAATDSLVALGSRPQQEYRYHRNNKCDCQIFRIW